MKLAKLRFIDSRLSDGNDLPFPPRVFSAPRTPRNEAAAHATCKSESMRNRGATKNRGLDRILQGEFGTSITFAFAFVLASKDASLCKRFLSVITRYSAIVNSFIRRA